MCWSICSQRFNLGVVPSFVRCLVGCFDVHANEVVFVQARRPQPVPLRHNRCPSSRLLLRLRFAASPPERQSRNRSTAVIMTPRTPNRCSNDGRFGALPSPHSQTLVAGRLPAATRAWLTGCEANKLRRLIHQSHQHVAAGTPREVVGYRQVGQVMRRARPSLAREGRGNPRSRLDRSTSFGS